MATAQSNTFISEDLKQVYLAGARADIDAIERGLRRVTAEPGAWPVVREDLMGIVHNVKGQGTSFGYPLMTRIAQSLSTLLKASSNADAGALKLASAHAAALSAVLDHDISSGGGELGESLAGRLESLVAKIG